MVAQGKALGLFGFRDDSSFRLVQVSMGGRWRWEMWAD